MIRNWPTVFRRIKAALMRRGRSEHDAEDLVQEAWIRLDSYASRQVVDEPEAFLMRTAINLSTDSYRSTRRHGDVAEVDADVLADPAPGIEAILLGRERMTRLSEGVACLNAKTRDIFLAQRVHGMSYQEIAHEHRLSVSAVEKHIARATLVITRWMEGW